MASQRTPKEVGKVPTVHNKATAPFHCYSNNVQIAASEYDIALNFNELIQVFEADNVVSRELVTRAIVTVSHEQAIALSNALTRIVEKVAELNKAKAAHDALNA